MFFTREFAKQNSSLLFVPPQCGGMEIYMGLTPSQQNAVDVRDRTLLVSAAAGSGKTYTLTQRIIKAIIEDGQDLSRLLIVTFTRAAAGELKAKISKALGEAIAEHPENIHLQKQLIKLGSAHISTIDSFFSESVRTNFDKLALPASMRLADDAELSPIRDRLLSDVLDSFYAKCEPYSNAELSPVGYKNPYTELIGIISGARDSSNILPTFFDIYRKLMTSPEGLEQLKFHAKRLLENSRLDFFDTLEGKALKDELLSTVTYARRTFLKCAADMHPDPFLSSKYGLDFEDNAALCHTLLSAIEKGKYADIKQAFASFKPAKISSISADMKTERSENYKKLRTRLNGRITELTKLRLYLDPGRISELFILYSDMCVLLYEILSKFDAKYSEEKRRRGICEFADMPRFMLKLLQNEDKTPTEYAKTLAESFDEVYIDEYQDVNEIQDTIFALIGGSHRFMVGDIKQSIYGFREADPSIFADYRRDFPIYDGSACAEGLGNTIFMSENFRCDENVISFTNAVCSNVFSAFAQSIGYTEDDDLKFGKKKPYEEYKSPSVELNILEPPPEEIETEDEEGRDGDQGGDNGSERESSNGLNDEATVTANAIAELLRSGKNADGTPITPGNIAVLVRSHVHARPLISALSELNIKYALSSKGELFENEDMRLLVNLLSVIDNPREDIPLCHLLTAESDIYYPEMSLEDVIKIRRASEESKSLYDALISYSISENDAELSEKCKKFISTIEKMRDAAGRMGADKLIKSLIFSERYNSLTLTEAYAYLYDSACRYVKNSWNSLYSFINYFKGLIENGESGSEPDQSVKDAVRIMSMHQSKGLEFNVCFIFGAGKRFNTQNRSPIIFNKEFGPSMKLPPVPPDDPIESIRQRHEDNPIYKTIDRYNVLMQLEEEARIFYVALTRARERLIISASMSKPYLETVDKLGESADTVYEIRSSRSYINWILLSLSKGQINESVYKINLFEKGNVALTSRFSRAPRSERADDANGIESSYAALMQGSRSCSIENSVLTNIPSKVAASKVSSHMLDDTVFIPAPPGILFSENEVDTEGIANENAQRISARIELMRSQAPDLDNLLEINKKPTAAEKGTAAHAFLQFCDYKNIEKNGIEAEITRLKANKFISDRTADIIDRSGLRGFFNSELYSYISSASNIRREFKFGMFRSASDFTENDEMRSLVKNKKIYVQGSVDLIIEMQDGSFIICDYKTDRPSAEERANHAIFAKRMRETHSDQLDQYEYAMHKIFGKAPNMIFIYSLALGESIRIK